MQCDFRRLTLKDVPFAGNDIPGNEGDYAEEDQQIIRQRKRLKPELGDPVIMRLQLCYAAKTWHGGFLGMMIFGASEVSRNVDLGDETTAMICKFVVRASDAAIIKEVGSDLQSWCDDLTDGGVEYLPEDEVKVAAAERLKLSLERIAILKAAQPPPKEPKIEDVKDDSDDDDKKKNENAEGKKKHKAPTTLFELTPEEVEHRALQTAILQEWHALCKDRNTEVK